MSEYIYKLNLPSITDLLLPGIADTLFVSGKYAIFKRYHPIDLLNFKLLSCTDRDWNELLFFYKPSGYKGVIHTDTKLAWGINWVYQGVNKMEYWNEDAVIVGDLETVEGGPRMPCSTSSLPVKTYFSTPGVYLVNAAVPHRATGLISRYTFSLRSCPFGHESWDEVVTTFQHLII